MSDAVTGPDQAPVHVDKADSGYNKSLKIREAEYIGCRISGSKVQSVTVRALFTGSRYNRSTGRYEQFENLRLSTLPNCRIYPVKDTK